MPSQPEAASSGKVDTGRRAGKRALGRSPGDCSGLRSLVSRRSWPQAFHRQRPFRRTFGQWLIFPFQPGHSARRCAAPVHLSTNVRSLGGHPSSFPLGTLVCSHCGTRHPRYDGSCREGRGPPAPTHRLAGKDKRQGGQTHDGLTALFVDILLQ